MFALLEQRRTSKTATRWRAAACAALSVAMAMAAWAQTNAPVAVTSPAAAPAAGVISEAAPTPVATNTVSRIEMLQNDGAFQSYTNLLEHSLFVPASEIGGVGAGDTGPTFAGGLRLTGIVVRGNVTEASIEDRNDPDKRNFFKAGDVIPDTEIKVVGFDLRGRAVLLKKGDEEGRLEYETEAMPAPVAAKPGVPGMPAMPPPQGVLLPRPGMPPTQQPSGMSAGARTGGGGFRTAPPAASGGSASGSSNAGQQTSRREQRQQQIARLQQVMQSTADPAAKQRLQSYIQMLEKANTQE
ncbi:MAG: hypothetical protein NTY01_00930 [Verrucomicrobia bacterium]|nr:hypothetical protein [Verrucomicrobiota bacterium]